MAWHLPLRQLFYVEMHRSYESKSASIYISIKVVTLKKLDNHDDVQSDIQLRYLEEAKWYEKNAVEIYQTAYNKNPSKSYKLLTRVQYSWGKRTVFELAVEGRVKEYKRRSQLVVKFSYIASKRRVA